MFYHEKREGEGEGKERIWREEGEREVDSKGYRRYRKRGRRIDRRRKRGERKEVLLQVMNGVDSIKDEREKRSEKE